MTEQGESLILEEDIDPNYEPTEEEILEYASFLGMNLKSDRDLFWIATEGLKAPLPDGWKPCQTREGDIYYFNFDTGKSQWEHPCDDHFRKMYETEKKKKEGGRPESRAGRSDSGSSSQKSTLAPLNNTKANPLSNNNKLGPIKVQPLALGKLSNDSDLNPFAAKKDDDLFLQAEQEKRINNYREQKIKEFENDREDINDNFKELKDELLGNHKNRKESLETRYREMKKAEAKRMKERMSPSKDLLEESFGENGIVSEDIRKEYERKYQQRIRIHKEELHLEIQDLQKLYKDRKRRRVEQLEDQIGREFRNEIRVLEEEINKYRSKNSWEEEEEEENYIRRSFINEEETKFQLEIQEISSKYDEQLREMKIKEDLKFQEQLKKLFKQYEKLEPLKSEEFEDARFISGLEVDLKQKIEEYRKQSFRKFDVMKINSQEKIKEYEKIKRDSIKTGIRVELDSIEMDIKQEKEELEKNFVEHKLKFEKMIEEDFTKFQLLWKEKYEDKRRRLQDEKMEKIAMLKLKLGTLQRPGDSDYLLKQLEKVETKVEETHQEVRFALQALSEEERTREEFRLKIFELEQQKKSNVLKRIDTNSTRGELETLKKVLGDRQRILDDLKKNDYGSRLNTERTEDENNENDPKLDEIEQIHQDIQDIKSFVKTQIEEDFDDKSRFQRSLSRPRFKETSFKENSFNAKLRKAGEGDKRILENKRREIIKNIRMVEQDEEAYMSDDQKLHFLSEVKSTLRLKLTDIENRLRSTTKPPRSMARPSSTGRMRDTRLDMTTPNTWVHHRNHQQDERLDSLEYLDDI